MFAIKPPASAFRPIKTSGQPAFSAQAGTRINQTSQTSPDKATLPPIRFGSGEGWLGLAGLGGLAGLSFLGEAAWDKLTGPAKQLIATQDDAFRRNFGQCDTPEDERKLLERYFTSDDPKDKLCAMRCMEFHFVLNGREKEVGSRPLHPNVRRCLNEAMERLQHDLDRTVASAAKKLFKKRARANDPKPIHGPSCY